MQLKFKQLKACLSPTDRQTDNANAAEIPQKINNKFELKAPKAEKRNPTPTPTQTPKPMPCQE